MAQLTLVSPNRRFFTHVTKSRDSCSGNCMCTAVNISKVVMEADSYPVS